MHMEQSQNDRYGAVFGIFKTNSFGKPLTVVKMEIKRDLFLSLMLLMLFKQHKKKNNRIWNLGSADQSVKNLIKLLNQKNNLDT